MKACGWKTDHLLKLCSPGTVGRGQRLRARMEAGGEEREREFERVVRIGDARASVEVS